MNNQQNTIKTNAQSIFSELALFSNAVTDFNKKAREIAKDDQLSQLAMEQKTSEARAQLVKRASEVHSSISVSLTSIRKAAVELEEAFAISPELQAAITLISAAGDKLDAEARDRMWKQFIGNKNALLSLKAMFESKGMYTKELEKHIISADTWCDQLDDLAFTLKIQPGTNWAQLVSLGRKLEEFCKLEGVVTDKPFIEYLDADGYGQYYTEQLKAAFGI